jgi:hypothetical protein
MDEEKDKINISEVLKFIDEVQEYIRQHKDDRVKEIGDRVLVWDGSYNVEKNTGVHYTGIDPLFKQTAIVIDTDCNHKYWEELLDTEITLDLLLKFDTGEEVYTKSEMVKRIDDSEI